MIEAVVGPIVGAAAVITFVLTALYRRARHAPQPSRHRLPYGRRRSAA